jgi:hypothetical protein
LIRIAVVGISAVSARPEMTDGIDEKSVFGVIGTGKAVGETTSVKDPGFVKRA